MLKVKRGTTYTFKVKAGEYHPLSLTSSIVGGGSITNYAGETVYAGGDTDFGERRAPAAWAGRVRTQRAPAASVLRARARVQTCALPSPAAPQARPPSLPEPPRPATSLDSSTMHTNLSDTSSTICSSERLGFKGEGGGSSVLVRRAAARRGRALARVRPPLPSRAAERRPGP